MHGLEAKYYGKIRFVYLDRDDPRNKEWLRHFGFYSQPEFYLLDGQGVILHKWVGPVTAEEFEAVFSQYLGQ